MRLCSLLALAPAVAIALAACASSPAPAAPAAAVSPEESGPCAADHDCIAMGLRDPFEAGCCQHICENRVITAQRGDVIRTHHKQRCSSQPLAACPIFECPVPPKQAFPACVSGRCVDKGS